MAEFFDIRTLSFLAGTIYLFLVLVMVVVYKQQKTYPGFKLWVYSWICDFAGLVLVSLRDFIPDFFTIIVANFLIMNHLILMDWGITKFCGGVNRRWQYVYWGLTVGYVASFVVFTYVYSFVTMRIIIMSLIIGLLLIHCAFQVAVSVPIIIKKSQPVLLGGCSILGVWFIVRAIFSAIANDPSNDFMSMGAIHGITFLVSICCNILIVLGFIILTLERVSMDLLGSLQETDVLKHLIPICSSCKKVRDDDGYWEQVDRYMETHLDTNFTHSLCPECMKKLYPEIIKELNSDSYT